MDKPVTTLEQDMLDALAAIVGAERVSTNAGIRETHGRGESYHPSVPPDAVVFARSTEEISAVVRLCAERSIPIIPYGVGSSLEGHLAAPRGGISLDVSQMDQVLEVHPGDMDVVVQPGVTRKQLNEYLRDTGLFFPIDPGANASVGGMAATRASGTNAVRYGTMSENVLNLKVVLADGSVIETGGRARKSSAGYDLTKLFVGSEGTLGIFSEITLKVYGIPEAISSAVCAFETLEGAVECAMAVILSGIPVARCELLDDVMMAACNAYSRLDYEAKPTLFFEFHGTDAGVAEQAEMTGALAAEFGGGEFRWARKPEERNVLWTARDNTLYAAMAMAPGRRAMITDVCVPISRLAECVTETKADIDSGSLPAPIVGHVGDGNFHCLILIEPDNEAHVDEAEALNKRLVARALALGGTCTGEHGIGSGKIGALIDERGPAVDVMQALKRTLDPKNILNPGKMFR